MEGKLMTSSFPPFLGEVECVLLYGGTVLLLHSHAPNRLFFFRIKYFFLFFFCQRHYVFHSSLISEYSLFLGLILGLKPLSLQAIEFSWLLQGKDPATATFLGQQSWERQLRCGQRQGRRWVTCLRSCLWLPTTLEPASPHPLKDSDLQLPSSFLCHFPLLCLLTLFPAIIHQFLLNSKTS